MDRKRKADLFLFAGILMVGILILIGQKLFSGHGSFVTVSVSGTITAAYPLSEDREVDIVSANGGTNHLVIKDGEAYVTGASCPDGLCINMGKISKTGQSVICLPNEVIIEITNEDEEPGIDGVT